MRQQNKVKEVGNAVILVMKFFVVSLDKHEFSPFCRKIDIVDAMLHKLEKYADNLESIVQRRTAELEDEKLKTDMLLHRMLPQ